MKTSKQFQFAVLAILALAAVTAHAFGIDLSTVISNHGDALAGGASLIAMGNTDMILKALDGVDSKITETKTVTRELADRVLQLEQKGGALNDESYTSTGPDLTRLIQESAGFKMLKEGTLSKTALNLPANFNIKAAIINATGQNQPLVQADRRMGFITAPERRMTVRDLLPTGTTDSNLIEYTKENVFTNNAGPQYVGGAVENVLKPESALTFVLANAPVITLAHWIPASKQVLDDSAQLQSYIANRLMYGLRFVEELQILKGDGATGNLSGLLNTGNFTAYNRTTANDTYIDQLDRAATQVALSDLDPTAIVINPEDWETIRHLKNTANEYLLGNPADSTPPALWGLPVVATNAMTKGTYLVGDFLRGAQVWDRQQARVEISREDGSNFTKNMVTILCEERLALTVYRPLAFVKGTFV